MHLLKLQCHKPEHQNGSLFKISEVRKCGLRPLFTNSAVTWTLCVVLCFMLKCQGLFPSLNMNLALLVNYKTINI